MSRIKGTRYETMRKLVRRRGPEFEKQFVEKLTAEEKERFYHAMPVSWIDLHQIPEQGGMLGAAAEMFFADSGEQGIQQVAMMLAQDNFNGIYRVLLRIPSVEFVMKRVLKIWKTYNDTGEASLQDITPNSLALVVEQFPDMPAQQRIYLQGFLKGMLALSRAKHVTVQRDERNAAQWRWVAHWE